jgi:transcriptional regulator of arginine metabolism
MPLACIFMQSRSQKVERQKLILKIIKEAQVATQTELRDALKECGMECDQATVSRDIKEMGLIRVSDEFGNYHYSLLEEATPAHRISKLAIVRRFIKNIDWSGNIIVIQTDSGSASPVAEAIDHLGVPEILGTIAGDNTIFAVVKEGKVAKKVVEKILKGEKEKSK